MGMGSRFVLLILLAKLLDPADVGLFGLFVATVSFSMLVIGGDYYTYSQRELLSRPREEWSFVLQHQAVATGLLYIFLLPSQLLLFWFELLPGELLIWFFALLIVEHIAQEINRLLVAMQHPLIASWVLFIRMGAWVWVVLPIMWIIPEAQSLHTVFIAWLPGALLAIFIGAIVIYREISPWRRWPLDRTWIRRGFTVGMLFLLATICFKALLTVDRYVVEHLVGVDMLGVYVLYIGIAMTVVNFLDPAVFSFLYPRIVSAYRQGDLPLYQKLMREMTWSTIGVSLILVIILAAIAPFMLEWIGRAVYAEHLPLLWLLLAVAVTYAVAMIPHWGLYARGADRSIVFAHISSLVVFCIAVILLAKHAPFMATAYGLLAAFTWIGIIKFMFYQRLARQGNESSQTCPLPKGNV